MCEEPKAVTSYIPLGGLNFPSQDKGAMVGRRVSEAALKFGQY